MITELLPCPYCGGEASIRDAGFNHVAAQCKDDNCDGQGLRSKNKQEAIAAWNRRFICLDKNGEKVFAGDKVSWGSQKYPAVACTTPSAKLAPSGVIVGAFNNIELIKEDT